MNFYLFSSLLACYTFTKISRQLQYTLSIFVYGTATILLPYLTDISQYLFLSFCYGFSNAFIDISTNLFIFELFNDYHLNFHVNCVHFCLSIGQTFGPLMLGPFLAASVREQTKSSNESSLFLNYQNSTNLSDEIAKHTNIFIPFTIGGALFVLCSFAMMICWLIDPYIPPDRSIDGKDVDQAKREIETKNKEEELVIPNRKFYMIFVFLAISVTVLQTVMDYQFLYFLSIYLSNYLKIDGIENTNLCAIVGSFYMIGRGINVLITMFKVSVTKVLYANIALLFAGGILIAYFIFPNSDNLSLLIKISVILLGLGFSSSLPGEHFKKNF